MELFELNRSRSAAPLRGHYCAFVTVLRCHEDIIVSFFMLRVGIKQCTFWTREISLLGVLELIDTYYVVCAS